MKGNKKAPDNQIYVCTACGKTSEWLYGWDDQGAKCSSPGWDASCTIYAELFDRKKLTYKEGRVVHIDP